MQPSRGCIVGKTEGGASSAEDGTGADARPSASRTAGRPSAPPGRGQAAKAVFRRGRMARIRRMRGAPQAGRAARRQARTPPERPNAPAPTARDFAPFSRRTGAERAGARRGRARSQSADWRAARTRAKRPFPPGANGWGEVTRTFGRSARYDTRESARYSAGKTCGQDCGRGFPCWKSCVRITAESTNVQLAI